MRIVILSLFLLIRAWTEIKLEHSAYEVKRPGERVKISCILSGYRLTGYNIRWIQQRPME